MQSPAGKARWLRSRWHKTMSKKQTINAPNHSSAADLRTRPQDARQSWAGIEMTRYPEAIKAETPICG
jgi:hypothetical protein